MNRGIPVPRPEEGVGQGGVQVAAAQPFPARQPTYSSAGVAPVTSAPLPAPNVDTTVTGGTKRNAFPTAPSVADAERKDGWAREGGSKLTVQPGETVYNLSRRFGVPVNAILAANGLGDASELQAGQDIVIPAYANGAGVPVSAPDNNPKVANARSTTGFRNEDPVEDDGGRGDKVAVLPQQPKLKESEPGAQPTAASASSEGVYTVAAGDTLSAISRRTGVSVAALKQANGLDSGLIRIGQKLTVPGGDAPVQVASAEPETKVDSITTSGSQPAGEEPGEQVAAYTPPTKPEKVIRQATAEAPDSTGIGRMRWPVRGRVIDGFGLASGSKQNDGIDIAVPEGTPIKAAENGVVIYAGDGLKEFGNTVLVRHEDGLVTVYGHASELKVERGQKVRRGEEIALAGMSGSADRPQLHFEVRKDSAPVDPIGYLE